MKLVQTQPLIVLSLATLISLAAPAQPTLSGLTIYGANNATGSWDGVSGWNTLQGSPVDAFNVYLFTNTVISPVFLNSGNTDNSLNPNASLGTGVHTFQFVGNTVASSQYLGINLYFNNDLGQERITALVPYNGSSIFSVVQAGINTYGLPNGSQPSSGSLSFSANGFTITLTDFQTTLPHPDLVGNRAIGADGTLDTLGSFTLTVATVPEPTVTAFGIAALGGLVWKRFRGTSNKV